jgi:hypothetical protein
MEGTMSEEKTLPQLLDKSNVYVRLNPLDNKLESVNLLTGEVLAYEGQPKIKYIFSAEMGEAVCNAVRRGMTLTQISNIEGLPDITTLHHWKNKNHEFAKNLREARRDRANIFYDKAVQEIDRDIFTKDEASIANTKFNAFLRLAEKDSPEEFGEIKPQTGQTVPTVIIVNTGIDRSPEIIDTTSREIVVNGEEKSEDTEEVPQIRDF